MPRISPGWDTDLQILEMSGSEITRFDDHLIVRTPQNPDYHWGNCLLVLDPAEVDKYEKWRRRYFEEFPRNEWLAIGLPALPSNTAPWEADGVTIEKLDVLSSSSLPKQQSLADGYTARIFQELDWQDLTQKELSRGLSEGGYEPSVIEAFVLETNASRIRLVESGHAAWFGAFFEGELVAHLGIVRCGKTGRYQSVETNASHRRKGLASHLLGLAASWSQEQGCDNWVIVTQENNDAGRVYRRAGFTPDVAYVNAYKQ